MLVSFESENFTISVRYQRACREFSAAESLNLKILQSVSAINARAENSALLSQ
jgi:hypothetical protein